MLTSEKIACEQFVYLYSMVSILVYTKNSDVENLTPKVEMVLKGGTLRAD